MPIGAACSLRPQAPIPVFSPLRNRTPERLLAGGLPAHPGPAASRTARDNHESLSFGLARRLLPAGLWPILPGGERPPPGRLPEARHFALRYSPADLRGQRLHLLQPPPGAGRGPAEHPALTLPAIPAGRTGKIEKFFRYVDTSFLPEARNLIDAGRLNTLDQLNEFFWAWLEVGYNNKPHSATGQAPRERFAQDPAPLRKIDPVTLREIFL